MSSSKRKNKYSINDLPEELLLEIFYNLTPKDIHKIKVVCKLWSSLISDPSFPKHYFHNTNLPFTELSPTRTLFFHPPALSNKPILESITINGGESTLDFLPPTVSGQPNYYVGSSNGLVLCGDGYFSIYKYYVCNPLTKQWITVRKPSTGGQYCAYSGITCDPSYYKDCFTRFKIVRIMSSQAYNYLESRVLNLEIFDSETGKWSAKTEALTAGVKFGLRSEAVDYKGVLHWLSESTGVILAIDPNLENCRLIKLPEDKDRLTDDYDSFRMGVSKNQLHFVQLPNKVHMFSRNSKIWKLKDYGKGEWCLESRFILRLSSMSDLNAYCTSCEVLAIDPIDNNILYVFLTTGISSVNIKTGEVEKLCDDSFSFGDAAFMFHQRSWATSVPMIIN